MTSNSRKLPPELWLEIGHNMSHGDLRQLCCVDTTLNIMVTPVLFQSITIKNREVSAQGFWDLLHTNHIARHVQSITFVEDKEVASDPVWKRLEAAFAILHRTPASKTLKLLFNPSYHEYHYHDSVSERHGYYSHQWDNFAAIGSSQYPLPRLRSLSIHRWMPSPKLDSLYYEARIPELAASLQHLRFSIHRGRLYYESEDLQFWNQVVVPRILQPAIYLESLEISREIHSTLDISKLATYPRLAVLSLWTINWEGTISRGDNIMRHRMTLKKLELYNCRGSPTSSFGVGGMGHTSTRALQGGCRESEDGRWLKLPTVKIIY